MAFRKGDEETAYRNSNENYRKLSFVDPSSDGNHVPYNKRFAPKNSWANLEIVGWKEKNMSITLSEGHTRADGGSHSKTISVELDKERMIQIRDFLNKMYPVEG